MSFSSIKGASLHILVCGFWGLVKDAVACWMCMVQSRLGSGRMSIRNPSEEQPARSLEAPEATECKSYFAKSILRPPSASLKHPPPPWHNPEP